ncbi:MAG: sugar phosphate nucleotidyltransferase [Candidatus Saelkia tenebricola]|nr:sugar phosphate nucleotidyltransferase [Candidatus Saelkia tenebricola]
MIPSDVLILCGGQGKRIQSIAKDKPKAMIEINGRPFLDILLKYIADAGFKRVILCVGYKADVIKKYYTKRKTPLEIIFSQERKLLGTAGAVKNAESFIGSEVFLILNGDSFCDIDLEDFSKFHIEKNAFCSIVLSVADAVKDYGSVFLNEAKEVVSFDEKTDNKKDNYVNAGIYFMNKGVLSLIPKGETFSLEKQFFPGIVKKSFYGYVTENPFIDIGVPSRYKLASEILK